MLLGKPKLALLDEPASGLDPISRYVLYAIIDELAAQGTAVLITSHTLTEVEAQTDRIAILRDGKLVANDTLAALARLIITSIILGASFLAIGYVASVKASSAAGLCAGTWLVFVVLYDLGLLARRGCGR